MDSPFLYLPLDLPLFLVLVAFGAAQEWRVVSARGFFQVREA